MNKLLRLTCQSSGLKIFFLALVFYPHSLFVSWFYLPRIPGLYVNCSSSFTVMEMWTGWAPSWGVGKGERGSEQSPNVLHCFPLMANPLTVLFFSYCSLTEICHELSNMESTNNQYVLNCYSYCRSPRALSRVWVTNGRNMYRPKHA